jgi:2'-5' RNA ligase
MIRAFVGIPLGETATEALLAQQAGLPAGRPVPPENFHITLAFVGEHPMPVVEDVHYALADIRAPGFACAFAGLDLLGGDRPRVAHAAVRPDPALKHLRDRVLDAIRSTGIPFPRERFVPHVTLARLPPGMASEDLERLRGYIISRARFVTEPFAVERFALFRSHLGRSGATYEEMASYPLSGSASG